MLVKVPSTSFVPLSGQVMDDEPEEDASFFNEIGRLFDSRKTSTFFLLHRTKLCSDHNEARQSMNRRIKQKNKAKSFFMSINYLCISYVLFVDIFPRSFDDFISVKFLIAVFFQASPFISTSLFINFGNFCQPPRLLHPPCLLFYTEICQPPCLFCPSPSPCPFLFGTRE